MEVKNFRANKIHKSKYIFWVEFKYIFNYLIELLVKNKKKIQLIYLKLVQHYISIQ